MVFRYAVAHGYSKRNPAAEIRPSDILKPTRKINMARIEAKELPALLRAIELYDGRPLTRQAIKLMALTFVRTSELIGARWEEFDFDAQRWTIPPARMKMKTSHIVPLSSQTVEALELLRTISGKGELVLRPVSMWRSFECGNVRAGMSCSRQSSRFEIHSSCICSDHRARKMPGTARHMRRFAAGPAHLRRLSLYVFS